ncbi:MAG: MerR family DNA-binding transcriptional regulator [Acidobacteria bacterium]|nr:MerR family DNA-binding transcriptional regulator [Acidobacteriota bacterium]
MAGQLIGDVAERTGLTAPTIRYYEISWPPSS